MAGPVDNTASRFTPAPARAHAADAALGDGGTRRGGAQDEHARHRAGGVDLTARVEG